MANLPSRPRQHVLESESRSSFDNILPKSIFLSRDEVSDYGVDKVLEAISSEGQPTNYRLYVQIKSSESVTPNSDGSFSLALDITNINYLLNQPNGIFVFFLADRNRFLWAYVREVCKACSENGIDPHTTSQKSFSFRFTRALDGAAFQSIHADVMKNGALMRNLADAMIYSVREEGLDAAILLEQERVTDIAALVIAIRDGGVALMNERDIGLLIRQIDMVPAKYRTEHGFAAIAAYAMFYAGRTRDAMSWLPDETACSQLPPEQRSIGIILHLHFQHVMGALSHDDYLKKLSSFEDDSFFGLQTRIERLRRAAMTSRDEEDALCAAEELEACLAQLRAHPEAGGYVNLSLDCLQWEVGGYLRNHEMLKEFFIQKARMRVDPGGVDFRRLQQLFADHRAWFLRYEALQEQAKSYPATAAQLGLSFVVVHLTFIGTLKASMPDLSDPTGDRPTLEFLFSLITWSENRFRQLGMEHMAIRAHIHQGDVLEGLGMTEEARRVFDEARKTAERIGALDLVQMLDSYLSGLTLFGVFRRAGSEDHLAADDVMPHLSEEDVERHSRQMLEILRLPEDRLVNIRKEIHWSQEDALERQRYCRHLQVLQDLRHTMSPSTRYAVDPERVYSCQSLGHRSRIAGTDRPAVIGAFKETYCRSCTSRSPGLSG